MCRGEDIVAQVIENQIKLIYSGKSGEKTKDMSKQIC